MISTGNRKDAGLATVLALTALGLGACGSGGGDSTVAKLPPMSAQVAGRLAKLSDRVASDLDAGDTCHAAHAADDLRSAVEQADMAVSMRPAVDEVTGRLVDEVNCPPPPPPPASVKKKEKPPKPDEHAGDHDGGQNPIPPGHAKHGGFGPPGHAKLEGK